MGLLDTSNLEADSQSADPGESVIPPGMAEPEAPAADDPHLSRRQAARQERESVDAYKAEQERLARELAETRNAIQERDRELYRLRGTVEQIARQPAPAPVVPAPPDPATLHQEAAAALEAGKFDVWRQKTTEAIKAEILKDIPKPAPQVEQPRPVGFAALAPEIQIETMGYLQKYPEVAARPDWMQRVAAAENLIIAEGSAQPGPESRAKAFEEVAARLAPTVPKRPTFSRDNRQMLSGGAHVAEGGSGDDSEGLSAAEVATAARFGVKPKEYAAAKKYRGTFG